MDRMIWMDCEMTGLDPFSDRLLEIAIVVTDGQLNVLAQKDFVVYQSLEILKNMDDWNTNQHKKSGLWEAVLQSLNPVESVQQQILEFLQPLIAEGIAPLCGNSIHQDRYFLKKWMPKLEKYVHYRNIDVSTLKQVLPIWLPQIEGFEKESIGAHRAMSDVLQSIEEMRYYQRSVERKHR